MDFFSYWVELIHANVKYPMVEIIGFVVAVFGFLLPWRSAYNKHIDVYWGEPQIIDCSFRPGGTCHPQKAFMVRLQIVNTSNMDMGYFDLCAAAADGRAYNMFFKETWHGDAQKFYRVHESGGSAVVWAPPAPTGVFPANTSTTFHLLVTRSPVIEQVSSEIILMFRTTERSFTNKLLAYGDAVEHKTKCLFEGKFRAAFSSVEISKYVKYKCYCEEYKLDESTRYLLNLNA